jgi:hypothetical protein
MHTVFEHTVFACIMLPIILQYESLASHSNGSDVAEAPKVPGRPVILISLFYACKSVAVPGYVD